MTAPFCASHPRVSITVRSMSSIEIQRGLDAFELDIGMTYLDNEPLINVRALPLYWERYVLLTSATGPFAGHKTLTWAEAASVPLCMLTPDMQNRRILERRLPLGEPGACAGHRDQLHARCSAPMCATAPGPASCPTRSCTPSACRRACGPSR